MYDKYNRYDYDNTVRTQEGLNAYISKVFGWMFLGLLFTAGTAYFVASSYTLISALVNNPMLFLALFLGELGLVFYLTRSITKMNYTTAVAVFLLYSILNGVTLSFILLAYEVGSIANTFAITAVTFGVMAVYGLITKTDLTRVGNLLFMGLIGLLILSLVNIFFRSDSLGWLISIIGLFVFLGLTAYDTQKIKGYYHTTAGNQELSRKLTITGALSLYLDFINLFLMLLRLFGKRR